MLVVIMMYKLLLFFIFASGLEAQSADEVRATKVGATEPYLPPLRISKKYFEGEFLIYDCKSRHFACVDQASYESCQVERKEGLDAKSQKILACAPLKAFSNLKACSKEQYILQHRRLNKSMCLAESGAASH